MSDQLPNVGLSASRDEGFAGLPEHLQSRGETPPHARTGGTAGVAAERHAFLARTCALCGRPLDDPIHSWPQRELRIQES